MRSRQRAAWRVDSEHLLLLKGLMLWCVVAFAFLAAWHYGLLQRVWLQDRTGLSVGITLMFLLAALRGSGHLWRLSRALNHAREVHDLITGPEPDFMHAYPNAAFAPELPRGRLADYIRDLYLKARNAPLASRLEQGLLLESFESDLRRGHEFGWFVADLLLSLGLLGTVIGFIVMLGPISQLDSADESAIKGALAAMSGGMAVALYTTLTGLIGGILLKIQGFLLDGAVQELLRQTTQLTEVHVLPTIERMRCHEAA